MRSSFVFWLSIRTRIKTCYFDFYFKACPYFDYPLEQGLRLNRIEFYRINIIVFWLSIRTRIKTQRVHLIPANLHVFWLSIRTRIKTHASINSNGVNMYFDYPLEQGLRQSLNFCFVVFILYFDYPLEQGLRPPVAVIIEISKTYFDYPLEQGLRRIVS